MPDKPKMPSLIRWILIGVASVCVGTILFMLHAAEQLSLLQTWNAWLLACLPVVICLLIFGFRSYFSGLALGQWQLLEQESLRVQKEWNRWAERYITVIDSCVLFPDKITAPYLMNHADSLEAQWGLIRRIDYLPEKPDLIYQAIYSLLNSIAQTIIILPTKENLRITLAIDIPSTQWNKTRSSLADIWQVVFSDIPQPQNINITNQYPSHCLNERLKQAETDFELLLVIQLHGKDNYSDGLAIFLLATDDMEQKYRTGSVARILRPMSLDITDMKSELEAFFSMQTSSSQTKDIIGDSQKVIAMLPEIFPIGHNHGAIWSAQNVRLIEMFTGVSGPFSEWLVLALAADFSNLNATSSLTISNTGNWITTVVPGKATPV